MKNPLYSLIPKFVKATVAVIITKNNKILLEKRSLLIPESRKWCLPGGHIDAGETAENAIKREIREELGVSTKNLKFLGYSDEILPEIKTYSIVLIYSAKTRGKFKPQKLEVSEISWFTKEEISKLNVAFKHKEIIEKYWSKK